jgi:hypothetical protein
LLREIAIIQEIFGIYAGGLNGVSDGLKERIDDGLKNGKFDGTAHYDNRKLLSAYTDHVDNIEGMVDNKA